MEPDFSNIKFNQSQKTDLTAREISKGQKAVIFAFLINMAGLALVEMPPYVDVAAGTGAYMVIASWGLRLFAVLLGLFGIFKIAGELEWSTLAKIATFILLLLPIINLITLLVVNAKATAFLKKAGYKVGLAGAYK